MVIQLLVLGFAVFRTIVFRGRFVVCGICGQSVRVGFCVCVCWSGRGRESETESNMRMDSLSPAKDGVKVSCFLLLFYFILS